MDNGFRYLRTVTAPLGGRLFISLSPDVTDALIERFADVLHDLKTEVHTVPWIAVDGVVN